MTREPIFAALFAKLAATPGLSTSSRILKHFSDVLIPDQPALFLSEVSQTVERSRGLPKKWIFLCNVYVYVRRAGMDQISSTNINNILDAIEAALEPPAGTDVQTLGGLVEHCWIEGTVATDEGTLGEQAVAIIPIRILVTS